jgi:hypothetical protein
MKENMNHNTSSYRKLYSLYNNYDAKSLLQKNYVKFIGDFLLTISILKKTITHDSDT